MSGFLGQILQGVMGGGQQGQGSAIAGILQQVLAVKDGDKQGVAAIISKFQSAGLGPAVQSWVGTGQNAPVSSDQIGSVFSQQQIEGWAQQAGTHTRRNARRSRRGIAACRRPCDARRSSPDPNS